MYSENFLLLPNLAIPGTSCVLFQAFPVCCSRHFLSAVPGTSCLLFQALPVCSSRHFLSAVPGTSCLLFSSFLALLCLILCSENQTPQAFLSTDVWLDVAIGRLVLRTTLLLSLFQAVSMAGPFLPQGSCFCQTAPLSRNPAWVRSLPLRCQLLKTHMPGEGGFAVTTFRFAS